jgi:hypothetical protein
MKMKNVPFVVFVLICLLLGACSAWASVTGSTNPNLFTNTIDWCAQASFACGDNAPIASPQSFTAASGATGAISLYGGGSFQALQEGTNHFGGSFPDGMGLLYNGVSTLGNTGGIDSIFLLAFDQPQYGFGTYIQTYFYGPFEAEVILLDNSFGLLGGYVLAGNSTDQAGDLMFIGAIDNEREVAAALVFAVDQNGSADFEIGTAGLATPEPSSLLLMAPSMLGLIGVIRRRASRKSQEVL